MTTSDLIQTIVALIAVGAIVVSWLVSSKSIRANDRATKLQRVIETSVEMQSEVGVLSAEMLPFWTDNETRAEHAQMPQTIKVHRAIEQIWVLSRMLHVHVMIAAQSEEPGKELTSAASMLAEAAMTLYHVLIPSEGAKEKVEEPLKYFLKEVGESSLPVADAKEITERVEQKIKEHNDPSDSGNYADKLVEMCKANFADKLAEYAGRPVT